MSILQKYGGANANVTWVKELGEVERKAKSSYLDIQDSESVASSIQEEQYQKIR